MKSAKYMACGLLAGASAFAQKPIKTFNQAALNATGVTQLDRDTIYHLSGRVFVGQSLAQPQELKIESGTVIKGLPGDSTNAAALIITKWGRIQALGTAAQPIVFTAMVDNENDPTDLGPFDRGLWGGVLLLGNAPISEGTSFIEGIAAEPRAEYGGSVVDDSSGVMQYVSIRHGGKIIGAANELNGLTMGGVGSKTVLDHIEVFANNDDGFEWFGGTVNAKYLVSAYGNDDAFDFDFGYRGKLQYGFSIYHQGNTDLSGNQGIEGDGYSVPTTLTTDTTKFSKPKWSNLTLIGSGNPQTISTANDIGFRLRDGTAGDFKNFIVQDWRLNAGRFERQASLACDAAVCQLGRDSLNFEGSVFHNIGAWNAGLGFSSIMVGGWGADSMTAKNVYGDPALLGTGYLRNTVDPRPAPGGLAFTTTHYQMADAFFDNVTYAGAFGAENWMNGWTAMSQMGLTKKLLTVQPGAGSELIPARLYRPATWDFVITQGLNVAVNTTASTAFLDGADVSSIFRTSVWPFPTIVGSERVYRVNGQTGAVFGAAGNHNLRLRMVLNDGRVLEDTFYWTTFQ
jgi:hypothetical protein